MCLNRKLIEMKKVITLLLSILPILGIYPQSYRWQMPMSDVSFYLDMFNDGSYVIKYSNSLEKGITLSQFFSYGKYNSKNNKLTLNDAINNYTLELDSKGEILSIEKGFGSMKKGVFKKISDYSSTPYGVMKSLPTLADALEIRQIWDKKNLQNEYFTFGKFESISDSEYQILLYENNKYRVIYNNQILSEGIWQVDNNWILLKDYFESATFQLFINNNDEIRSCFAPGDYTAVKFKRAGSC